MGSINSRLAPTSPIRTHQPVQVAHIKAPTPSSTIENKTPDSAQMQKLKQAVDKKGDKALGSSAQANLIKAQIEAIHVEGIQEQAEVVPLTKMQTAGKYLKNFGRGLLAVGTLGISEAVIRNSDKISRAFSNTTKNMDISVSNRYVNSGSTAKQAAFLVKSVVDATTEIGQLDWKIDMADGHVKHLSKVLSGQSPMPPNETRESITDQLGKSMNDRDELKVNRGILRGTLVGLQEQMGRSERVQELLGQRADLQQAKTALPLMIQTDKDLIVELNAQIQAETGPGLTEPSEKLQGLNHDLANAKARVKTHTEKLAAVTKVLTHHRTETQSLISISRELETQATGDKALGKKTMNGALGVAHEYAFKGLLTTAKAGHSAFSLVNNTAVMAAALKDGVGGLLNITDATKDAAAASIGVSTSTVSTLGMIAAPVTIVVEGYALKQSIQELVGALNKTEKAEALISTKGRASLKAGFEKQLHKAEHGSTFSKANPKKAEVLLAKIKELDNLPQPEELSQESRAIAAQIIKHSDKGFKKHSAFKSTMAITAASLSLASLCMGPAAPVGLVVAATVLGVMAGVYGISMLVAKFSIPRARGNKVQKLVNNNMQIQKKKLELNKQKGAESMKHTIKDQLLKTANGKLEALKTFQQSEAIPGAPELKKLGLKASDFAGDQPQKLIDQLEIEVGELASEISELDTSAKSIDKSLLMLSELQSENTTQLLATSPYDAATIIQAGATATPPDKSMLYLSQKVLGVDCSKLSPKVAVEELARGMSLKPGS